MTTPFMTVRQLKCRKCGKIGFWTHPVAKNRTTIREDLPGDILVDKVTGPLFCSQCGHQLGTPSAKAGVDFALYSGDKLRSYHKTLNGAKVAAVGSILRGEAVRIEQLGSTSTKLIRQFDYEANEWVQSQ